MKNILHCNLKQDLNQERDVNTVFVLIFLGSYWACNSLCSLLLRMFLLCDRLNTLMTHKANAEQAAIWSSWSTSFQQTIIQGQWNSKTLSFPSILFKNSVKSNALKWKLLILNPDRRGNGKRTTCDRQSRFIHPGPSWLVGHTSSFGLFLPDNN
jgi:hypothetical protein